MLFANVAEFVASGWKPRIVIVGTGPAGLSLALRLHERKLDCLLVEAGTHGYSAASQSLYRGQVVGDARFALDVVRLRQFGGTSGHWSGWCRALDAHDFEVRPAIAHSGWPIGRHDLDRYATRAEQLLQIEPPAPDRALTPQLDEVEIRFSPPVRFGIAYRTMIERSPSIGLLLDTALTELEPGTGRIDAIRIVGADRVPHRLRVQRLVLCAGGIENSRLLLWSNARHAGGVVPRAETLGRYWMGHRVIPAGDALLAAGAQARFPPRRFFALSPAAMKAHGSAAARLWIPHHFTTDTQRGKALMRELLCTAPRAGERLFGLLGRNLRCGVWVSMSLEQTPRPDNRIELARDLDPLGVPRVRLHWRHSAIERHTAMTALRAFGEALIRHDLGRVRVPGWLLDDSWPDEQDDHAGRHHIGGTRMAASPEHGIVDRDCKVFGTDNLYIGGSSVFPTCGHAHPTLGIVQLALRLGDHLADTDRGA